ncbi:cytochrome P450 [Plenodomus tracheiphilus IPT5]|uniref:Cytochrome P450 n=1 Tax=Plenodomus tracheiphilus IPT5 TaxID=1408161 RepID=A0A6A7B259_9PLEO|nr:cytochrome P450 [Plenodomus tracheiphilus IPT5]
MYPLAAAGVVTFVLIYVVLQVMLHSTQHSKEPRLYHSNLPFFDSVIGILRYRGGYLSTLRKRTQISIHTLRMPFQRLYILHAPHLIHAIQSKANTENFVPNLLEFGMLFSGLRNESQTTLRRAFGIHGNGFTMSVHKYLLSGPSLQSATNTAIDRLSSSLPNNIKNNQKEGLFELLRHELTLALTAAIYGPENPYEDPDIESSWMEFLPGISHLLYSPIPSLTARKALKARSHVIEAFRRYFETDGHLGAFPMISEMYEINKRHGLTADEAAKMELATSLAMLSSGAITTFWLLFQILSDVEVLDIVRKELLGMTHQQPQHSSAIPQPPVLRLNSIKSSCPTLMAMLNETLRYHSTVINIKQVKHDTMLADQYLLKKNGIVMIPGQSVHHNPNIWGHTAETFDYQRFFLKTTKKNLGSTSAFRPFGAGGSMCPGRHFSINVILSLVAMIVLQYDIIPLEGTWAAPTKHNADLWNAMPKPDWDIKVRLVKSLEAEIAHWKFVW